MLRVGVIGPESTGKSTLCKTLSERCGYIWIKEYARTYVEQLGRPYTIDDLDCISRQLTADLAADYGDQVVLFDTEMIIMKVWYEHVYGQVPEAVNRALRDYPMDLYLLLAPDIAAQPDPVRENLDNREYFFRWYEREIQATGVPYAVIRGQGEIRTERCAQRIKAAALKQKK